jgi:hypothetical protein
MAAKNFVVTFMRIYSCDGDSHDVGALGTGAP